MFNKRQNAADFSIYEDGYRRKNQGLLTGSSKHMILRDNAGASLWQKLGLLAVILLLFPAILFADKSPGTSPEGIRWADSNSNDVNFFWLDIGGTLLSDPVDNDVVYPISLPFNFTYYNQTFSTIYISSNGYATFNNYGANSFPSNTNLNPNLAPDSLLAIYWDDLIVSAPAHPSAAPRIYSKVVGTAPYRKYVIGFSEVTISGAGLADGPLTFEIILHETTNIIKYQYLKVGASILGKGQSATAGIRYQVGASTTNDSITYSRNGFGDLSDSLAVLFYPSSALTSNAGQLDVTDVVANTSNQRFTLTVNNINLSTGTNLQQMGKADLIQINNPLSLFGSDLMTVSRVVIDGNSYFLGSNDVNPPSEEISTTLGAVATWSYNATSDILSIQTPSFSIKSSVEVEFQMDIPFIPDNTFFFNPTISSRTETANTVAASASFNVVSGTDTLFTVQEPALTNTVDQDLTGKFTVRVEDSGNNPIPGVPITFSIVQRPAGAANDSLFPTSGITNSSGQLETTVHLGTKAGTYRIRATAGQTTPQFVEFTATALADAADSIIVVSGNNQGGQASSPLANPIRFRLVDQFQNPLSGSTLNFNVVTGPGSGSVAPTSGVTNATGESQTTWTLGTDLQQQMFAQLQSSLIVSDTVNASVQPGSPVSLALVTLRQQSNDSVAVIAGQTVTVALEARDSQGVPVPGVNVDFSSLVGNVLFESSTITTNSFGRAINVITTRANEDTSFFRAQISGGGPSRDVHLFHLRFDGNLAPASATPGQSVTFALNILNRAKYPVALDAPQTTFSFNDGTNTYNAAFASSPILQPGQNSVSFQNTVINAYFTPTGYTPVISVQGTGDDVTVAGNIVLPTNSLSLITTNIAALTLQPSTVTSGTPVVFTVQLQNSGSGNVTLNQSTSYIMFNGEQVFLNQSYAVPGGGTPVNIEFETASILSSPTATPSASTIHLEGTNNGVPITPLDLSGPSTVWVQGAPNVIVNSIQMLTNPVVQNQDVVIARVQLANQGSNLADASIDLSNDITLATSQLAGLTPTGTSTITLSSGTSVDVDFQFSIAENYPAGNEFLRTTYQYTDVNSQILNTPAPVTNNNAFTVLQRATLSLESTAFGGSAPPGGMTTFSFTVRNSGEADVRIENATDIQLDFNNANGVTITSPLTFPITITSLNTRIFNFDIDVDPGASSGQDPVDLQVLHTDAISGKQYLDIDTTKVDILFIDTGASSDDVQILVVDVPSTVNVGQSNIPATVQIKNFSGSSIQMDDVTMSSVPTGITGTLTSSLPDILNPNETGTYNFTLSVSGAMPAGNVTLDASYSATDLTTLSQLIGSGASSPGLTTVLDPAAITISAVSVSPATVNTGQGGIIATAVITNGTGASSDAEINSLQTILIGPGSGTIVSTRISPPTLPLTLSGGQSLQVQFQLDVPIYNPTGNVSVNLSAVGVDGTSGAPIAAASPSPGTLSVQDGSDLQFTAINVAIDSAFVGQQNIPISTTVQNFGSASARLNSVTLQLKNRSGSGVTFPTTLQTITLPDTISSGGTMDVDFLLNIPASVVLPPGGDSLIFAGAFLNGEDLNSGTSLTDTLNMPNEVDSFLVVDEADVVFRELLNTQTLYNIGDNVVFQVRVANNGGINYTLDGNTTLRLVKENDLDTQIQFPLNTGFTNTNLVAGDSTILFFQNQQLNILGNFRLFLDVSGTAAGQQVDFAGISTPQSISVGGNLSFQSFLVNPDTVGLGEVGVSATLTITNQGGSALPIDAAETVLVFNYVSDGEPLPIIAQRQDGLTSLPPEIFRLL